MPDVNAMMMQFVWILFGMFGLFASAIGLWVYMRRRYRMRGG